MQPRSESTFHQYFPSNSSDGHNHKQTQDYKYTQIAFGPTQTQVMRSKFHFLWTPWSAKAIPHLYEHKSS